jgi:hypothetical protein
MPLSLPQLHSNVKVYKSFYTIMFMSEMRFNVTVNEKIGKLFRMKVIEIKGNKKGALSEAVEEAIILWLEKHGVKIL